MLAETRAELDDFHLSSKELEEELERELERTEKAHQELKVKVARAESERDEWKVCDILILRRNVRLDSPTVEIHVTPNHAQHDDNFTSTGAGYSAAGSPEDKDSTSRTGNG